MTVPCGESEHWKQIWLSVFWNRDAFDRDKFVSETNPRKDADWTWTLQEAQDPQCHTHADLTLVSDEADDSEDNPAWVFSMGTYRGPVDEEEGPATGTLQDFTHAMAQAATEETCFVVVRVDLVFAKEEADWRMGLLAEPPEFSDLKEELGRIRMSGITLRFEESPQGLNTAELEVRGDVYQADLQFVDVLPTLALNDLHTKVLNKAERFASLFIDFS